ncbi:MAG: glycerol kinase GlpK [Microthrixaceae bacterium]|nr:glycerol kinase GlpK [Microthrixaceae bacterium]
MSIVLSIDAGTTGVRAFAVDESGATRGWSYREFTQHFPRPGWVEHDADEIWQAVQTTVAELVATLDEPIAAIGITDQRETIVAWSRSTGRPLHRAIVWQDRRTSARCDELAAAGHLDLVRSTTGLVLDPYFSGSKIEWLRVHGGVEFGPDTAVGTIDSWILWNLTGGTATAGAVHATDPSNASRTMLFDIGDGQWSSELCALFGVPMTALPEVRASAGRFGVTSSDFVGGAGVPVSGIAGDQQSALFGQACFEVGMTKNTYGTGSFVLMNVGDVVPTPAEGLLTTVAWTLPSSVLGDGTGGTVTHYALEGSIFATGAAIQWLRDGLGIISTAAEVGPLAESTPDSSGVFMVPAFAGLGSPYWDPYARGTIVGLTRGSGRAELARATVESMAYQTRDVIDAMTAASGTPVRELRVDGGASVMGLLLRLVADQLDVPVVRPRLQETTALGAAYLAGLAEGVWSTVSDVAARWAVDERVEPSEDRTRVEAAYDMWQRAVERSRGWAVTGEP